MLKMLGAACVIFSASAVGFGFSENVRRQCAQLTALIEALTYLKSEMLYRRTPLPQALGMLAEHSADAAVGGLFAKAAEKLEESCTLSVHAAFRAALGMADGLVLSAQTRQALLSLSLSLGQAGARAGAGLGATFRAAPAVGAWKERTMPELCDHWDLCGNGPGGDLTVNDGN